MAADADLLRGPWLASFSPLSTGSFVAMPSCSQPPAFAWSSLCWASSGFSNGRSPRRWLSGSSAAPAAFSPASESCAASGFRGPSRRASGRPLVLGAVLSPGRQGLVPAHSLAGGSLSLPPGPQGRSASSLRSPPAVPGAGEGCLLSLSGRRPLVARRRAEASEQLLRAVSLALSAVTVSAPDVPRP